MVRTYNIKRFISHATFYRAYTEAKPEGL